MPVLIPMDRNGWAQYVLAALSFLRAAAAAPSETVSLLSVKYEEALAAELSGSCGADNDQWIDELRRAILEVVVGGGGTTFNK